MVLRSGAASRSRYSHGRREFYDLLWLGGGSIPGKGGQLPKGEDSGCMSIAKLNADGVATHSPHRFNATGFIFRGFDHSQEALFRGEG